MREFWELRGTSGTGLLWHHLADESLSDRSLPLRAPMAYTGCEVLVVPLTVVEMPEFRRTISGLCDEDQILDIVTEIAEDPLRRARSRDWRRGEDQGGGTR